MVRLVSMLALHLAATAVIGTSVQAQVRASRTVEANSQASTIDKSITDLNATDRLVQDIWELTAEEMRRVKVLAQGPRRNFSVENLSPLEILGIHARTDDERRKYAERFAKIFRADVERSIAWERAYQEAMARLYPNDPMISFEGLPKVQSSVGAADLGNVPRSQIIEQPAPSSRIPARAPAAKR